MPVCLSPLSYVRLGIIRSYILHQTEYSHSPSHKQWQEACIVPAHDIYQNSYRGSAIIEMPLWEFAGGALEQWKLTKSGKCRPRIEITCLSVFKEIS